MAQNSPSAAGMPLALAIIVGTAIGAARHQVTIGLLAGLGIGVVLAVAVWLADRRRMRR